MQTTAAMQAMVTVTSPSRCRSIRGNEGQSKQVLVCMRTVSRRSSGHVIEGSGNSSRTGASG
jgi:hypothetical protein